MENVTNFYQEHAKYLIKDIQIKKRHVLVLNELSNISKILALLMQT